MKRDTLFTVAISILALSCSTFIPRPLDRNDNLFYQVAIGDAGRVRQLLRQGADPNRPEDTFERLTPLMIAAKEGHADVAFVLLTLHANPNAITRNGHTALMMATYNRYPKLVSVLLEGGADPHIKSNAGHTALSEITLSGKDEIIELLTGKGAKE